jgi:hypothetical protein
LVVKSGLQYCLPLSTTMACKKSTLIAAINSYVSARLTGDAPLINAAAAMLQPALDSLDYAPEEEPQAEETMEGAE